MARLLRFLFPTKRNIPKPVESFNGRVERVSAVVVDEECKDITLVLEGQSQAYQLHVKVQESAFPYELTQAGDEVSFGVDAHGRVYRETFWNFSLEARLKSREMSSAPTALAA